MKELGAAEGAGPGVELLLLLMVVPNRLGIGVVDDEVVELTVFVGLATIKENPGFGAVEESAALCPKLKDGFATSAVDVSLLSAGLPKL